MSSIPIRDGGKPIYIPASIGRKVTKVPLPIENARRKRRYYPNPYHGRKGGQSQDRKDLLYHVGISCIITLAAELSNFSWMIALIAWGWYNKIYRLVTCLN